MPEDLIIGFTLYVTQYHALEYQCYLLHNVHKKRVFRNLRSPLIENSRRDDSCDAELSCTLSSKRKLMTTRKHVAAKSIK